VKLTLYLLPDRGPISPVSLDLVEIFRTLTPPRPADRLGAGELERLCDAIRQVHPGVEPESNLRGLARVYANFGHADRFDGVVLRVHGDIPQPEVVANDAQVAAVKAELARRDDKIGRLRAELSDERSLVGQLTARLEQSQRELQEAVRQSDALRVDLGRARVERDQAVLASEQLEATLAARDRRIEELRAERRPAAASEESFPILES
jgi:hypothetical protein